MVGGNDLQVVLLQPFPEPGLMLLWSERRGEHVLGPFEVRPFQLVDRQQEVLGAGLSECRQPAVPGFPHFVQSVF